MKSVVQEASSIAKAIELGLAKADNPRDFSIKILEYPEKNFFGLTTKSARIALYWDDKIVAKSQDPHPIPTLDRAAGSGRERSEHRERYTDRTHDRSQQRYEGRRESSSSSQRTSSSNRSEQRERRDTRGEREQYHKEPVQREQRVRDQREVKESRTYREQRPEIREKNVAITTPIAAPEEIHVEEQRVPLWNAAIISHMESWLRHVLDGMHKEQVRFSVEQQDFCVRITLSQRLAEDGDQERKILASLSLLLLETSRHSFKVNLRGHKVLLTHRTMMSQQDDESAY